MQDLDSSPAGRPAMSMIYARILEFSDLDRAKVMVASGVATILIAFVDWMIQSNVSLGYLYVVPILMTAAFLKRWQIVCYAAVCAVLRERLEPFPADDLVLTREFLVLLAFSSSGLLFKELVQNQRLAVQYTHELESQIALRRSVEEQLDILIESTPAAIFLLGADARIISANGAAARMLDRDPRTLAGQSIDGLIPDLARIPISNTQQVFRTKMECTGRRSDGSLFLAEALVSAYRTPSGPRLAAVVLDLSEDLRDREDTGLDNLMATSRVLVGAVLHEIQNLCAAAAVAHANMARDPRVAASDDFLVLGTMVKGLEKVSAAELKVVADREMVAVDIARVFDEFRIVIEPSVQGIGGSLTIASLEEAIWVRADAHSMLQVLLNLSRNSIRAVTGGLNPAISIEVIAVADNVQIRFRDSGPGVAEPELLFQPFQASSESTGLGLYVSRAILRSFGGELSYEPVSRGSCFVVQLRRVRSGKSTSHDDGAEKENSRTHHRRPHVVSRRIATTA